jgi:GNAT superfamily N-acetyltransferase
MLQFVTVLPENGYLGAVERRQIAAHAPDVHLIALDDASRMLQASCSCWWKHAPPLEGHTVGTIGHYEVEPNADATAGVALIEEACRQLREAGCTLAVGPMDGNTWRSYRFVIDRGGDRGRGEEPPFFLEPDQPPAWPDHFRAAGFTELATYTSALNEDLAQEDPRLKAAAARLAARGVAIRAFDPDPSRAEADLHRIFTLSLASFSRNYLYTPIAENEFISQYRAVLPVVRPEFVLLAERGGELVGFLFAVPDMLQMKRNGATDTIVIKTVAVAPGAAQAGLGSVLVGMVQRAAHARGFRRAIHALMHERNVSQNISRRYARTIRRYALFARPLV